MENENKNSIGGTIILLALFAQSYIFGLRYDLFVNACLIYNGAMC